MPLTLFSENFAGLICNCNCSSNTRNTSGTEMHNIHR